MDVLEVSQPLITTAIVAIVLCLGFQTLLTLVLLSSLRAAGRERANLHRELFGLMKKIEGLTASRRDLIIKQYDKLHESLAARLPSTIASIAGQHIYETEARILKRLAELEPNLKKSPEGKARLDEVIRSMESLESTIVSLTAETVTKVMSEGRHEFVLEHRDSEVSFAA